jgi:small subunit ribosomal protein S20
LREASIKFFHFIASPYLCLPKISGNNIIMANHKSTKKDARQAEKRRERNRYYGKTTRNAIRELKASKDDKAYSDTLPGVISMVDKLAKKGVIHKNKASNLKRKLSKRKAAATA